MTFEEATLYLESLINYEKKSHFSYKSSFKLERVRDFLEALGNPQEGMKVLHVAGTKGKGSTASFIAHILKNSGYRVGLYTSPHLVDFRERIRILDPRNTVEDKFIFPGMILKNDFASIMDFLKNHIESFNSSCTDSGALTFFEVLTALALVYFKKKDVDFVVLETGLGGRLDATNAVDSSVAVLTPISYDHEAILGTTLAEIAFEKAGILKKTNKKTRQGSSVCICAAADKTVLQVIKRRARSIDCALFQIAKDFRFRRLSGDLFTQHFFYRGLNNESHFLKTRMLGIHQLTNASAALAACEALTLFGTTLDTQAVAKGVWDAFWPGRLEVVNTKPFVILDGAHNRDSVGRLIYFLQSEFKGFKKNVVFGACADKDVRGIAEQLDQLADRVILTQAANPRAADPAKVLAPCFRKNNPAVTNCVEEALELLKKDLRGDEVAVIAGSLFVVGEARSLWQG